MVTSLIADWRLWSLNDKHDEYELQSPKISSWNEWKDFNLDTIMNEYRDLLLFIKILYDPMPTPPRPIRNEELFKTSSSASWTDEFDVLSACASWLWSNKTCWETVPSSCSMKELAPRSSTSSIQTLRILSLISPKLPGRTVPGELKPSWKWSLELQHGNIKQRTEFLKTRHGFLLTDAALVAIRRVNDLAEVDDAHLQLSKTIPWTAYGNEKEPQLAMLLGLWYLVDGRQVPHPAITNATKTLQTQPLHLWEQRLRTSEGTLCAQDIVPDFLDVIKSIDPNDCNEQWALHPKRFREDGLPLNAVLIEYIPNIQELNLGTYTDEQAKAFYEILQETHEAL
ncbi:uncharacterized protein ACHE_60363A [Aspergillus chevalieri]|uniref:Uncharacterized protein n=1 Tax=Aspergillus chevalieri TaxID=182096 RepID=A0A7R7VTE6_ASPCH|nr:uncharacterized protein ACHE_60363A [Aspergillus chevalieri]BCR90477.1 hypothetical protein ACHE_60363A [Aspergillus chevalieri]